jgi:hypothetical protein
MPSKLFTVGAATATVVGSWTGLAATSAEPAVAASCDMSDAVVIGSTSSFHTPGELSDGIGKLYVKDSRSCRTEWAYLKLNGPLPSGATASAAYTYDNNHVLGCGVAVGNQSCSTPPAVISCYSMGSANGYKRTADGKAWETDSVWGSYC